MRDNFLAAFDDPDLLSHRSYVALHEARVIELLDQLKSSDAGDYRARLLELWNALETANAEPVDPEDQEARARKAVKVTGILNSIGKLIKDGAAEDEVWQAVAAAMRDRQQSATQEHRRLVELQGVLTIDQAMALVVVLSDIVKSEVSDLKALGRIGQKIQAKLGIDGPIPARVAKAMERTGGAAGGRRDGGQVDAENVVEAKVVDVKVNDGTASPAAGLEAGPTSE